MKISNVHTKARYSIPGRTLMAILFLKTIGRKLSYDSYQPMWNDDGGISENFLSKKKHLSDRLDRSAA